MIAFGDVFTEYIVKHFMYITHISETSGHYNSIVLHTILGSYNTRNYFKHPVYYTYHFSSKYKLICETMFNIQYDIQFYKNIPITL